MWSGWGQKMKYTKVLKAKQERGACFFQATDQVMNVHWNHSTLGANSASHSVSHTPSSRASGWVSLSTNSSAFRVMRHLVDRALVQVFLLGDAGGILLFYPLHFLWLVEIPRPPQDACEFQVCSNSGDLLSLGSLPCCIKYFPPCACPGEK